MKMMCFPRGTHGTHIAKKRVLRGTRVGERGLAVRSGVALRSFVLSRFFAVGASTMTFTSTFPLSSGYCASKDTFSSEGDEAWHGVEIVCFATFFAVGASPIMLVSPSCPEDLRRTYVVGGCRTR